MSLAYENLQALTLVQALWGVISPNFRAVSFECVGEKIRVYVILEHEDVVDREQIDSLVSEFEILQEKWIDVDVKTIISSRQWKTVFSEIPGRPLYVRRELTH